MPGEPRERYDLYLSYSGRLSYILCPKQYHHKYVLKDKVHRDPKDSIFGSVIGKVFEWFYNRSLWASRDPLKETLGLIDSAVSTVFEAEGFDPLSDPGYVWKLHKDLSEYVPHGLETIRRHRLLSPNSSAELDFSQYYRSEKHGITLRLGGRADFVHRHDDGVWILDGKASKHRERYTDSEQVIWYAMLHYLKYHVSPTRVGFIYWRFPNDPVQWVDNSSQLLRDCAERTFTVSRNILDRKFQATPSKACGLCPYKSMCNAGIRYLAERKVASDGRIESSIFDIEQL